MRSCALFAPLIAPYGEARVRRRRLSSRGRPRTRLGTDQLGRDMLTRLIYGARNTIGIAFVTTLLSFVIGGVARHHGGDLPAAGSTRSWPPRRRADVDPAADLRADAAVDLRLVGPQPHRHHRGARFDPRLPPGARRRHERRRHGLCRGGEAAGREARLDHAQGDPAQHHADRWSPSSACASASSS